MIESILHQPFGSLAFPIAENTLRIRIRIKRNAVNKVMVLFGDRYQPIAKDLAIEMVRVDADELFDFFQVDLHLPTRRFRYTFFIVGREGDIWYGDKGAARDRQNAGDFQFPYINEADRFTVPEWVKEGIIYQIFPERFANGDQNNDPKHLAKWGDKPKPNNFFGGDLAGIIEKLPYLEDLGINVIYLTPVFASPSNHKYDTIDYYQIDPHFGDLTTVKRLVAESHKRGIKIIFDAVFNHCGNNFFAFQDVVKNGENSPYKDWFHIESFPIKTEPRPNYETFANDVVTMPKLRTANKEVRSYLLDIARYWIREADIDGWRLDVSNEVDHSFWREFRHAVKEEKEEVLIIGEIWHDAAPWLEGDQYDSVMNYLFRDAVYDFVAKKSIGVASFAARLTKARMKYKDQANFAMFNLIDSHDTERFINSSGFNENSLKLAALLQMTYVGMPMIYYGTEIGMDGFNDPDCRKTFVWDEKEQNADLLTYYKKLIAIRKKSSALTKGDFRSLIVDEIRQIYGFIRSYGTEKAVVVINALPIEQEIEVELPFTASEAKELISGKEYLVKEQVVKIKIEGEAGIILQF